MKITVETAPGEYYLMTDASLCPERNPYYVPDFAERFEAFPSVAVRITRVGKTVSARFAGRYYDEAAIALPTMATDLLGKLKSTGRPWGSAVAFDRSCLIGNFEPIDTFIQYGPYTIEVGGEVAMSYDAAAALRDVDSVIERLSVSSMVKTGDILIFGLADRGIVLLPDKNLTITAAADRDNNDNNKNTIEFKIK